MPTLLNRSIRGELRRKNGVYVDLCFLGRLDDFCYRKPLIVIVCRDQWIEGQGTPRKGEWVEVYVVITTNSKRCGAPQR